MKKIRMLAGFVLLAVFFAVLGGCGGKQVKKDEDFDAEKFLAKAGNLVDERNYDDARKVLLEVKNRDTTKKYAPIAQLRIADSYIKDGDFEHGIEEYKKFLELYPDNPKASYVQYQIAMAYFQQIEGVDRGLGAARSALKELDRLKELYPRNPYREIITLRAEKCRDIIAEGEFYVGEFYYKKESYQAAIVRLEALLKQFPDYKGNDRTLLLLGKSYKALKMTDKAREFFQTLIDQYPSSQFVKEAKKGAQG
ncbi:MAG: outer membrane protein assembly factor BamD [Nitrospirae bacterium]|nr:outer membrane protein assembly factor BamD [Nitrospirota bacterium]